MITLRLADSIPRDIYRKLTIQAENQTELRILSDRFLDYGRGKCLLQRPDVANVVRQALEFYDGERFHLIDWCLMPNHIHFIYDKPSKPIEKIIGEWKSYTASTINKLLGYSGAFWQVDYFDRFARNAGHLSNMSFYTILNPVKAGLSADPFDWEHSSVHGYPPEFKDDLRRWYRHWRDQYWNALH